MLNLGKLLQRMKRKTDKNLEQEYEEYLKNRDVMKKASNGMVRD